MDGLKGRRGFAFVLTTTGSKMAEGTLPPEYLMVGSAVFME